MECFLLQAVPDGQSQTAMGQCSRKYKHNRWLHSDQAGALQASSHNVQEGSALTALHNLLEEAPHSALHTTSTQEKGNTEAASFSALRIPDFHNYHKPTKSLIWVRANFNS